MQPRAVPSTDTTAGDDSAPTSTRATELHPPDPEAPAVASRAGRHLIASLFAFSQFSQTAWALRLGGWPRADIAASARRISATQFVGHGRCICITSRTATTISTSAAQGAAHEQSPEQSTAGPGDTAAFTNFQHCRRASPIASVHRQRATRRPSVDRDRYRVKARPPAGLALRDTAARQDERFPDSSRQSGRVLSAISDRGMRRRRAIQLPRTRSPTPRVRPTWAAYGPAAT